MKFHSTVFFVILFFACFTAFADEEYVCNNGDAKRVILVTYESDQEQVPCEVQYDKGEGAQTLWSARSEVGFCENKASEFVEKQESWGWSCEKVTQSVYVEDLVSDLY